MLKTRWSKSIDKNGPLSEYPRPQFVRDSYFSLNGIWNYVIKKNDNLPITYPGKILVPFSPETELSGVSRMIEPDEYLFYCKTFTLPKNFNKGRVFINFGAVDQIAKVYLNKKLVGEHIGGYTPFTFEITNQLVPEKNVLEVVVKDYSDTKFYSRGKQKLNRGGIWYSAQSGIWQSVWIESTPVNYLKKVKITPNYDEGTVRFDYFGNQNVQVDIYDGKDLVVSTKKNIVEIPNFKSWSPENPFLYDVIFKCNGEEIKSYFGMRKFSISTDNKGFKRLFLNNKPYFHNGVLDQGYYSDGYLTPPSNEALENDVDYVKSAGFNMIRKHIKIEPLLWYHYCDVKGILVWQDIVNGGESYGAEISVIPFVNIQLDDRNYKNFHRTNKEGRELYLKELQDTIDYLYNCPCIAVWVPFNEGWGQFDSKKVYEKVKSLDNTRTVDTTSGWHDLGHSDVVSKHIYFTPIKVKKYDKPYLLSEFGGFSMRCENHTFNNKMFGYKIYKSKSTLEKAYKKLFNKSIIPQIESGLCATVYTQLTDVEDELNGLLTYDRCVEKIDINILRNINERIKYNESNY